MTRKRLTLAIVLTLLVGVVCASVVYAAGQQGEAPPAARGDKRDGRWADFLPDISEKWANSERPAPGAVNEAWDALTEAQKNELYAAKEAVDAAQKALYDKAAAYGLVDEETIEAIKNAMDENTTRLKENDWPPLLGFRFRMERPELPARGDFPLRPGQRSDDASDDTTDGM